MSVGPVAESRWKRKRKLLPKLRLKYPNDREMKELAQLAAVNNPSEFAQHIRSMLLDAHLNDASLRNLSIPDIRKKLYQVAAKARVLARSLQNIDIGAKASAECAGRLLEGEMGSSPLGERLILIPDCVQLLKWLNESAFKAAQGVKSSHGPKGAGGNPAFDIFIQNLNVAAWQWGGKLTVGRSANGSWIGSWLTSLEILRPYLPDGFFPIGELGRSVEHVRKKFKNHITKNQTSPN